MFRYTSLRVIYCLRKFGYRWRERGIEEKPNQSSIIFSFSQNQSFLFHIKLLSTLVLLFSFPLSSNQHYLYLSLPLPDSLEVIGDISIDQGPPSSSSSCRTLLVLFFFSSPSFLCLTTIRPLHYLLPTFPHPPDTSDRFLGHRFNLADPALGTYRPASVTTTIPVAWPFPGQCGWPSTFWRRWRMF